MFIHNSKDYDWNDPNLLIGDKNQTRESETLTSMAYPNSIIYNQELDKLLERENFDEVQRGYQVTLVRKLDRKIGKENFSNYYYFYWRVGSPDSKDASERIAYWMSKNLPEEPDKLKSPTIDLLQMWLSYKINVIQVAEIIIENEGKIITKLLEKELIDKMEYDRIYADGKLLRNIWNLIKRKWTTIRKYLNQHFDCPFKTPEKLFLEIVSKYFDSFSEYAQDYYSRNYKEIKKLAVLHKKPYKDGVRLEESEIKDLDYLEKKYMTKNPWLENLFFVLPIIDQESNDPIIKTHIQEHNSWNMKIRKLHSKGCSDPKNQKIFNSTWIKGKEYQGIYYQSVGGEIKKARE